MLLSPTMARRTVPRRRVVVGSTGTRRTIKAPSAGPRDELALDDRPLANTPSTDGRQLVVTLPYELWVVDAKTLAVQRTIPLPMREPSVAEGWEGTLWIGGQHLYRGNLAGTSTSKVGSKLGGYVDHVCLVRDDLLCGVGAQGEILWDIDREGPVHKRKSPGKPAVGVVASADGRAVFCDESETCWVIDPAHVEGYAQLRLASTSPVGVEGEAITRLGRTRGPRGGRVLLGARDGALAWTAHDLRLAGERVPAGVKGELPALALVGDERWVYVLRQRGVLQRFLISQPPPPKAAGEGGGGKKKKSKKEKSKKKAKGRARAAELSGQQSAELEPPPLPEAQQVRLGKRAECMTLMIDADKRSLVLGGSRADGQLGRLWTVEPDSLEWEELSLTTRELVEAPPQDEGEAEAAPHKPSFVATKHKLSGTKIAELSVDTIVGAKVEFWLTHGAGTLLERPTEQRPVADVLPGDALLLPAMVRFAEGTARPALVLWPGVVEDHPGPPPSPRILVWGDDPRGWMALETPEIRKQKWSRTDVYPLQVAIASVPEGLPGKRARLDERWIDREHFEALAKECKKMLKVLW